MADTTNNYTSKITGQTISPAYLVEQMIANHQQLVEDGKSRITDFNVGSEVRNLLEAFANSNYLYLYELDQYGQQLLIKYAQNEWLDLRGWELGLNRKGGTKSTGYVTFSISTPLKQNYTIQRGTRILNKYTGNAYILVNAVTILAGDTDVTGQVVSELVGEEYDCEVNTLTAFDTEQTIRSDLKVTNHTRISGGENTETDEDYRNRILAFLRGGRFGSIAYYTSRCTSVTGVHDVKFIKPELINAIQQGRHSIKVNGDIQECNECTAVCVVNLNQDANANQTIYNVNVQLTDQENLVLGHEFHVQEAIQEPYYFKVNYYAENDETVTEEEIIDCLKTLFYGGTYEGKTTIYYPGFTVGTTILKENIINALENMKKIHHIESLQLLGWHKNLSTVQYLLNYWEKHKNYYKEQYPNDYDASTGKLNIHYDSILKYPDDDDLVWKEHPDPKLPHWKRLNISTNSAVYQLEIDGFYFYKIKDNQNTTDSDAGEYAVDEKSKHFWGWGEKQFTQIDLDVDVKATVGIISENQPSCPVSSCSTQAHSVWVNKIK